jgi:Activator of Hsp90 ATPase homolog 1-like protein
MSETQAATTIAPIRREVVVEVGQERAFEVFTAEMTSWWPAEHHIGSAPIEEEVIEPRVGGRWFTRHQDGTETSTGVVRVWEPPGRLVVTWQIGADWAFHDDLVTVVELRFLPEGSGRTRVVLEHRDLEAYAEHAASMRDMFDGPGAWDATLAAYAAAAR